MKKRILQMFVFSLLTLAAWSQTTPVNTNSNQTTKNVLTYLWNLSYGSTPGVIVGQNCLHGNEITQSGGYQNYVQNLANNTGKYVGMIGVDYEFMKVYSIAELKDANTKLAEYWNAGGLITINYSPLNILDNNSPAMSRGGSRQIYRILSGGDLRNAWLARLDVIAAALQDLQSKGVTVLWRPMQESNGPLFWYATGTMAAGGQTSADFISLYRDMYNYFTYTKGLNNLLWVFAPTGSSSWSSYPYPGDTYVDVVAGTTYNNGLYVSQNDYNVYKKPIGVSEFGWDTQNTTAQDNMLYRQRTASENPQLAYFVCWHDWSNVKMSIIANNNANSLLNSGDIITRDELPNFKATTPPPTSSNLALNKYVAVSSTIGSNAATNAVDGNSGTRWESAWTNNEWIYTNLGATYNVTRVKILWEAAYAKGYKVQISGDAVNWTDLYNTSTGDGNTDDLTVNGNGQYVRILINARGTSWGNSIWEFEVYGTAASKPNLLANAGFESGTTAWSGLGATIAQTTEQKYWGTYACKVTARQDYWASAQQVITSAINANGQGTYYFEAWVRLTSGTAQAQVVMRMVSGAGTQYLTTPLAGITNTGWVKLTGTINLTWSGTLTEAAFYVETNSGVKTDMYLDDCFVTKGTTKSAYVSPTSVYNMNNSGKLATVYPNPVRDVLNISLLGYESNSNIILSVYNLQGRLAYTKNLKQERHLSIITSNSFSKGIYFLTISDGVSTSTKKIVIE